MRELRIRNIPDDLYTVLETIAKRNRCSIRVAAIILMRVGQTANTIKGQSADEVRSPDILKPKSASELSAGQAVDKVVEES